MVQVSELTDADFSLGTSIADPVELEEMIFDLEIEFLRNPFFGSFDQFHFFFNKICVINNPSATYAYQMVVMFSDTLGILRKLVTSPAIPEIKLKS